MVLDDDACFVAEALRLGNEMLGRVWPNPAVGCVIVRHGRVVGRGQTQIGGRPHAERVALADAGTQAAGSTVYATLEPCCHWGQTPPCTEALIQAGVARVMVSTEDPDPRVNGGGIVQLRDAGMQVDVGLARDEAEAAHAGFFHRIRFGRPLVYSTTGRGVDRTADAIVTSVRGRAHDSVQTGNVRIHVRTMGRTLKLVITRDIAPARAHAVSRYELCDTLDEALALLGSMGLTRIAVPSDDAIAPLLRDATRLNMMTLPARRDRQALASR